MKIKKIDINTLVDLVVNTARADTTSPDPKNPRVGWRTDQLLIGDVDKLMCYRHKDPASYAEIGRRVLAKVHGLPNMEALAHIAVIRGERLGPVSAQRKNRVSASIADLEAKIGSLSPGSRKERLASLLVYNKGVFYDAYEMFAEAAVMQELSAEIAQANGDKSGEAIGYFLQAVYLLKDALCQSSTDEAKAVFSIMGERYVKLVQAVRGTPLEVSWGQANGPCHMIQAYVWLDRDRHGWDARVASVSVAADKLGQAWQPIVQFVRALDLATTHTHSFEVDLALEAVANSDTHAEMKATVLLVLARRALAINCLKEARGYLNRLPKKGASHIRAVAERLL